VVRVVAVSVPVAAGLFPLEVASAGGLTARMRAVGGVAVAV
jgi:hypothetical protein